MRKHWVIAGALVALTATAALAQGRGHGRGGDRVPPGQAKKAERQDEQQARFADRDREIARNWYAHERRDDRRDDNADRGDDGDRRDNTDRADRGDDRGGLPPGLRGRPLPPGLRDRDRLPPGLERKLEPGYVLTTDDRRVLYPMPALLVRQFAPPPAGFRYFSFGGHIVLVDNGFRVRDVIHLEIAAGN